MSTPLSPDDPSRSSPDDAPVLPPADTDLPPGDSPPGVVAAPARRPNYVFLVGVALANLVADLVTKNWAERTLQTPAQVPTPHPIVKAAWGGFGFMLARNKGGAWGLLHSYEEKIRKPFFVTVSVLAIVFIVSLYRRLHPTQTALKWGLPLVLGGALGNLVDRIRYGHVIDFIDSYLVWGGSPHHWPTFNVADISICVGVGLMAVDMLTARRQGPVVVPPEMPATTAELPPPPAA